MRRATSLNGVVSSRRAPRRARALVPLFATLGLALALSGCLGSTYAYISHRNPDGTELYFKIPARWTVFSAKQIVESQNGPLSNAQLNQIESGQWNTAFNASPSAVLKQQEQLQFINTIAKYPNGYVFARHMTENDRDALSLAAMRAVILGSDPLAASSQSPFNVLNYSEFTAPGGIRGSKLVTDISETGGLIATFAQVIAVDPQTNWIYGIGVSCRASCWGPNQGLINQVINSWKVKEQT